ncbi:MAG: hypothetical protein GY702_13755, partial [Desulfobulbaceae bacterium]|nr:hypothetical protein [Desulfobulbaceae bacterium]
VDGSDTGASNSDNITNDTTPTIRVTFDQSGAAATDAIVGDVVKLFAGAAQVGTATLIAGDITNGYVDITSSALTAGSLSFTATVTDTASNASGASGAQAVTLDTTSPTVAVTLADSVLTKGETTLVTFTFSEAPSGFANADVTLGNGTLTAVAGGPTIYTATFTPTDNLSSATNVISVGTGYTDAAGNAGVAGSSANYTIDTTDSVAPLAPSVDLVDGSDTGASNSDNITNDTTPTIRVTFDQSGAAATDAIVGDVVKLFAG